ncbi:putative transmembrane protein, partial [Gregarina niphandrodes]
MGTAYVSAWSYDLLVTVPSIIMLSSFSVIALFWAQVYYTSRFMVLHHSQFVFWFLNIGVYSILFVVAAMTKLLAAFEELRIYNALLLSALFLCVGIAFSLYGLKVNPLV